MARDESPREDLLREATALVERVEVTIGSACASNQSATDRIVAGFRSDGALSVFFGDDPVYQFNANGELRRAYCDGLLYKAVRGWLISLKRVRRRDEVQLLRHELTKTEQVAFLARMIERLLELAGTLDTNSYEVARQVPHNADVLGRVRAWLAERHEYPIAARPNA